jgi:hypothetical protein
LNSLWQCGVFWIGLTDSSDFLPNRFTKTFQTEWISHTSAIVVKKKLWPGGPSFQAMAAPRSVSVSLMLIAGYREKNGVTHSKNSNGQRKCAPYNLPIEVESRLPVSASCFFFGYLSFSFDKSI